MCVGEARPFFLLLLAMTSLIAGVLYGSLISEYNLPPELRTCPDETNSLLISPQGMLSQCFLNLNS